MKNIRPTHIKLDAATVCQLHCPLCETAQGIIKENLGAGFLSFNNFKSVVDKNPGLAHVELSNWGEIFLNPELHAVMEYAHAHNVVLTAGNGVNLNAATEEVLQGLVKFKFFALNCSIDGASQETYARYRRGGDLESVFGNIRKINEFKARYRSILPLLRWQFIAFGHNEHEIEAAQVLAKELDMQFWIKRNIGPNYSPVSDSSGLERKIHENKISRDHQQLRGTQFCAQLWREPQINWDGRLLGCCWNYWGDYGNVFRSGLEETVNGEKIAYARQMLMGKAKAREGIPCVACGRYKHMQAGRIPWVMEKDLSERSMRFKHAVYECIHRLGWRPLRSILWMCSHIRRCGRLLRKSR